MVGCLAAEKQSSCHPYRFDEQEVEPKTEISSFEDRSVLHPHSCDFVFSFDFACRKMREWHTVEAIVKSKLSRASP
jgi:hypothetical protein